VLGGRIKRYASFVPFVLKGAFEEEPLEFFLGINEACEGSSTLFLPIVKIVYQWSVLAQISLVRGIMGPKKTIFFLCNLQPQQLRLGF